MRKLAFIIALLLSGVAVQTWGYTSLIGNCTLPAYNGYTYDKEVLATAASDNVKIYYLINGQYVQDSQANAGTIGHWSGTGAGSGAYPHGANITGGWDFVFNTANKKCAIYSGYTQNASNGRYFPRLDNTRTYNYRGITGEPRGRYDTGGFIPFNYGTSYPLRIPAYVVIENVKYEVEGILPFAFWNFQTLSSVIIDVPTLAYIGEGAFAMGGPDTKPSDYNGRSYTYTKLTSVSIKSNADTLTIYPYAFGKYFFDRNKNAFSASGNGLNDQATADGLIRRTTISTGLTSVNINCGGNLRIEENAFRDNRSLTTINISSTGEMYIGAYAFALGNQDSPQYNDVNNVYASPGYIQPETTAANTGHQITLSGKITNIGASAFRNHQNFGVITINNTSTTSALTIFEYAFRNCCAGDAPPGTLTINGPINRILNRAFFENTSLKTWKVNSTNPFLIDIAVFGHCTALDNINGGTTLPSNIRTIGNYAFMRTGFSTLTIPDLPLKNTSLVDDPWNMSGSMGQQIFSQCAKLKSVVVKSTSIGIMAFNECPELEVVEFAGTRGQNVDAYALQSCPKLKKVIMGENVQTIGPGQFCNLKDQHIRVIMKGTQPPYAAPTAFYDEDTPGEVNVHVVVPAGHVNTYLFSADNEGFQAIKNDNISCEYTIPSSGIGSIGWQKKTRKKISAVYNTPYPYQLTTAPNLSSAPNRFETDELYDLQRTGISSDGINTNVSATVTAMTADYYYKSSGKVGTDPIVCGLLPGNKDGQQHGYLVQGTPGQTVYLRTYTGQRNLTAKVSGIGSQATYNSLNTAATNTFNAEQIDCPWQFRTGSSEKYQRSAAPNLLIAGPKTFTGNTAALNGEESLTFSKYGTKKVYYYMLKDGGFQRITGGTTKEGKAYLAIPVDLMGNTSASAKLEIGFDDDDDNSTTGINWLNPETSEDQTDDAWYTLQGVRLDRRPTQSGVYIHKGRKEVIR